MTDPVLLWFREDLRLADNPALRAAAASKRPLLAVFVLDDGERASRPRGGAARWWLHGSLRQLATDLERKGGELYLYKGEAEAIIPALVRACGTTKAFWNRRYDKAGCAQDAAVERALTSAGCLVETFNGKLLFDPETIRTKAGTPFRTYAPFWRATEARGDAPPLVAAPRRLQSAALPSTAPRPVALDALDLLPRHPDWAGGLRDTWTQGEAAATERLRHFIDGPFSDYAGGRDRPAQDATTRLSPHLAAGELSPRQLWHAAQGALLDGRASPLNVEKLKKELAWRDYAYHLLVQQPDIASKNLNPTFDRFPWLAGSAAAQRAWQKGLTGYPIVDAGMRQLWQTGWMHNRVRLITGSFLVKHLLVDWRQGEAWFWDTLCDADPANNAMNWQWIAGSGADAAPYFRVFNPVLQGERFDPDGSYVRQFVPELRSLPAKFIHRPWEAAAGVLAESDIKLGRDYPMPIVDHAAARARALAAFRTMRGVASAPR